MSWQENIIWSLLQMYKWTKRTYLISCAKRLAWEGPLQTQQHIKSVRQIQNYDPLGIHSLVTSQHDKESYLLQEKPFLWAQDWKLQQEWKGNELYKTHVSRGKQQSTEESFNSFRDRSQLSKEQFHLKDSLESCAARKKEVIKSSSPINRILQQEGNSTFEQKKKNIFIKNLFVYKSLKNYIFVLSRLLFSCIKSLKKINTFQIQILL